MRRFIFVEDTYGVDFHKELINKISSHGVTVKIDDVRRLPAKECNPAILRKIKAALLDTYPIRAKVVIVVDSECESATSVKQKILRHFKKAEGIDVRIIVVEPRHEAWLCIGLGYNRRKCRSIPDDIIAREKHLKAYDKQYLARFARHINLNYLYKEEDFKNYVDALKWISTDP